jgi:magnesium transporter
MGEIHTRMYRKGSLEAEDFPVAEVSEHLHHTDTVVWVDFCEPSREELEELAGELDLHELAVEDALEPHQRPKIDHYDTHEFLSCHAVRVDTDPAGLAQTEIGAFIGDRWLITVRKDAAFSMEPVRRRWDSSSDLTAFGVSYLLYGLLDVIVDGYFDAIQLFDDYYDQISEGIFSERPLEPAKQRDWFNMRRALVHLHRQAVPLREAVSRLMRHELSAIPPELYPYYQDVYDHILRITESTESLRDLSTSIVEASLGLRDYRQNQVMKKVTSWAAIIAVPTLITGYYGMNVPYPGSERTLGFVVSTLIMVGVSGGLYLLFRRKDWL